MCDLLSREHFDSLTLCEAYVLGVLDEADASALEAHVMECASCEKQLQKEAALELAFTRVAAHVEHVEVASTNARVRRMHVALPMVAGAALAMAAAFLLWIVPHTDSDAASRAPAAEEPAPQMVESNADASTSTFTASLDLQVDGSRLGVRD